MTLNINKKDYLVVFEKKKLTYPTSVSVVITLFNYEKYIEKNILSVASQTYLPLEIIIIDDSSNDRSLEIAKKNLQYLQKRFINIILIKNIKNMGLSYSRNLGFLLTNSDFVFSLDADNQIYPRAIERLYEAIKLTKCEFAYSQLEIFDKKNCIGIADIFSKEKLKFGNYIDAMALIKKKAFLHVGGYSQMVTPGWEDFDLWCKFCERKFKGIFVPEILCRYRFHKESMLNSITNRNEHLLKKDMKHRYPWLKLF